MNELQIFESREFGKIRIVEIDNEPWFVGKDVAVALAYKNTSVALQDNVDIDDKVVTKVSTSGGMQETTVINESGLYSMVFGSRLPNAKKFKKWVTSEVIPTIRKTGGYHVPQTYAEALRAYADAVEAKEKLALENKELKPKAEFFDAVTDSKDAIPMADVAKVLDVGIGRNKLFEFLRHNNILMADNRPYQKYIDAGYFRVVEQRFDKGYGETGINIKTLVFQKGVDYIRKKLKEVGYGTDEN